MNAEPLDRLLTRFRHKLALIAAIRVLAFLMIAAFVGWSFWQPRFLEGSASVILIGVMLVAWVALAVGSISLSRTLQMARVLLNAGQRDNAEFWLRRVMTSWSLTPQTHFIAGQHLASLFVEKQSHQEVVSVCQELLRHRLRGLKHIWINTRLMLTDSLLHLDRVAEAYEAIRPIYDAPLTLADRMKLLPVQLRYELRADQAATAVQALAEKVRIAELLDSEQAALVHALLAEACRRRSMAPQSGFLLRRARLYSDLDPLAQRYGVLTPLVTCDSTTSGS